MAKKIVVTGADGGVGMSVVRALSAEGYDPICFTFMYTDNESELRSNGFTVINCDFRDRSILYEALANLKDNIEEIYGIVNVAGVYLDLEDFARDSVANFEETFGINFWPSLILASELQDRIASGGSIVSISSTDAYFGAVSGAGYSASKAALNSLTMSLANILSPRKVRANGVAIGWAGTGMNAPKETIESVSRDNLLGRVAGYEEVADLVLFLLSERASYINGTTIAIDGGDSATNAILAEENRLLRGN